MPTRYVETYECEDDEGNRYLVHEFQQMIRHQSLKGTVQELPGSRCFRLTEGEWVNRIDEKTFETFERKITLRRIH